MKVVITDYWYENLDQERQVLSSLEDVELQAYHCKEEKKLCELVADADAVIVQFAPITAKVIEHMRRCKLIVRYAIGVDNIDLDAATAQGIYVANVPDYCIDEVSDHAIALLLALAKKLVPLSNSIAAGKWDYRVSKPLYRIRGRRLGLVGFGRIPCMVAEKMRGFGVEIQCYDPYIDPAVARQHHVKLVFFEELLETSDYISIHCPLTKQTYHMFDEAAFRKMKPESLLINTARGAVVEEKALIRALKEGWIGGAGIDVSEREPMDRDSPLLEMENVILTPHNAWYSEEAIASLQRKVAEEVVRVLSGEKPANLVNKGVLKQENKVCLA